MPERRAGVAGEVVLGDRLQPARSGQRPIHCVPWPPWAEISGSSARPTSDERADARGAPGAAGRGAAQQPQDHGTEQEDGEVVAQQRQRAAQREQRHPRAAWARASARRKHSIASAAVNTNSAYGARLLRVPHEQRVDGDQRRAQRSPCAAPGELAADRPRDGHRRDPGERRGQPQRDRAGAEHARVRPLEHVPERRLFSVWTTERSVAPRLGCRHVDGRERLVVPEALQAERRQAQHRGQQRQRRERPPARRARRPRRARRAGAGRGGAAALTAGSSLLPRRGAEAAVALATHVFGPGRQIPAAVHRAPPVDDRPPDRQADLRAFLRAPRGWCCRRRPRACCVVPSSFLCRSRGSGSRGRCSARQVAGRRSGGG